MNLTTHDKAPIATIIDEAEGLFRMKYGFKSERIHCSRPFAKALIRYITKTLYAGSVPKGQAAEYQGHEILFKTKPSPHFEFDLSATRDGEVLSLNVRVQPQHVDEGAVLVQDHSGVIQLGEDSDGTPDLELLDADSAYSAEDLLAMEAEAAALKEQQDNEPS